MTFGDLKKKTPGFLVALETGLYYTSSSELLRVHFDVYNFPYMRLRII